MFWREIWERKGAARVERYDLDTLIRLDGWDGGAARLTAGQFREIGRLVQRLLRLKPGVRILEVGCGAGALLWCLRETGAALAGIDYSAGLVAHARRAIPEARYAVAEAAAIPFVADAVVVHSVFQYFPDFDYARRVLEELRRAAPRALILDVPDAAKREASQRTRREMGSKPGTHRYYPKSFFKDARVWDSDLKGYGNSPFRFHAYFSG